MPRHSDNDKRFLRIAVFVIPSCLLYKQEEPKSQHHGTDQPERTGPVSAAAAKAR